MRVQMSDEIRTTRLIAKASFLEAMTPSNYSYRPTCRPQGCMHDPRSRRGSKPTTRDAADEMQLALWRPTHGEPDAQPPHQMPEPAGSLRPRGPTEEPESK